MSPPDTSIPDKLYFKIGEVSKLVGVAPYVLRFWETEFKQIKPKRTKSGQRLYRKKDVETLLKIKHFLHEKKFTIKGAIKNLKVEKYPSTQTISDTVLEDLINELVSIRDMLSDKNTLPD
jgi:DNA-binding transcriptional MerR regulator